MRTNNQTNIFYFCALILWMWLLIYVQSDLLYLLPKSLRPIDIATISILCIFLENNLGLSFLLAILSGALLDSMSTIKPGFFMLYYLISILLVQISSKFFSYENLSNKFIIFLGLFLLKFILIYSLINDGTLSIIHFVSNHYLQFLISIILFFVFIRIIQIFKLAFYNPQYSNNAYFKSSR